MTLWNCLKVFFPQLQAFAKEGAQVTATDINGEKLKELDGIQGKIHFCCEAAICWPASAVQPEWLTCLFPVCYIIHSLVMSLCLVALTM